MRKTDYDNTSEKFLQHLAADSSPAQKGVPAVKVMTCHAVKGLEFPFVILAGQARSKRSGKNYFQWLPIFLEPKKSEGENQIDSVLFVGTTRARQMLVISYASTSSGLPRAEKRIVAPLLKSWCEICEPPQLDWKNEVQEHREVEIAAIWGGKIERPLTASKLDKDSCAIATYLRDAMNLDFPVEENSLYPIFFTIVRRTIRKIIEQSFENGQKIEQTEGVQILTKEWSKLVDAQNKHHDLFFGTAKNYIESFASEFVPEKGSVKFFGMILGEANNSGNGNSPILFDLVCAYQVDDNAPIALLFRPENFDPKNLRENGLLWSLLTGKNVHL